MQPPSRHYARDVAASLVPAVRSQRMPLLAGLWTLTWPWHSGQRFGRLGASLKARPPYTPRRQASTRRLISRPAIVLYALTPAKCAKNVHLIASVGEWGRAAVLAIHR